MNNDRDMFYGYGGGYVPMNNMPGMGTQQMTPNNYASSQFNDMTERINRLERQVKRLDQRLTRLETPYANNMQQYNSEPDNNMYMM